MEFTEEPDKTYKMPDMEAPSLRNSYLIIMAISVALFFLQITFLTSARSLENYQLRWELASIDEAREVYTQFLLVNYALVLGVLAVIAYLFRSEGFKTLVFLIFTGRFLTYALLAGRGRRSQLFERGPRRFHKDSPRIYATAFLLAAGSFLLIGIVT